MTQTFTLAEGDIDALHAWTIIRAARKAALLVSDAVQAFGLTPVEFGVLAHLGVSAVGSQAALARAVMVRPQSLEPALDALVGRGLIVRSGARGRGRKASFEVTASGAALLQLAYPAVRALNSVVIPIGPREFEPVQSALLDFISTPPD